jgi:hypothetical protein
LRILTAPVLLGEQKALDISESRLILINSKQLSATLGLIAWGIPSMMVVIKYDTLKRWNR